MIRRRQPRAAEGSQDAPKGFDAFELRLGDVMRGERATLGKSLLDVQRELKIRATYIAAIENADPTAFETPGFIAGYVRSYARYLGLDPEWAYRRFCEEGNFATVNAMDAAASPRPQASRRKSVSEPRDPLADPNAIFVPRGPAMFSQVQPGAIGSMLVLLSLIAVLGYGGWSVLKEIQQVRLAPLDDQPGLIADVDPLQVAGADPLSDEAPATPPSVEALDRLYRPQALDRPVMVARDGPIATIDPGEIGVLSSDRRPDRAFDRAVASALAEAGAGTPGMTVTQVGTAVSGATPVQVVAADATPELALLAVRPAWVRVSAADGTVLLEKILNAGESYVLPRTDEPPTLRAGNSGSVYFSVNGRTYGPSAPGANVAKNIELSPKALTERYQLADIKADPDLAVALAQNEVPVTVSGPSR
ncbi:helix-turn-helix domain-containing protein [Rhodovulum visakhapatnamense]|uniref:Cytoskeletal protein RodZ n=1 Tax=Rhodovulum visakhapatnamense TaxID=364297 RepID=A0A4R8FTQ3_9RHOB|nr:helix-turn-helix domain-containing protein [Rhodovulum visakhapatnamense]TDX30090.1 cytoskeletal protein RodZ [Rhodovulum visakhapatnamense]